MSIQLVIWDCDNTLWDGILEEIEQVKLKPETHEILKQINKLGITQAICSRNHKDKANNKLFELGIAHYFNYSEIEWEAKNNMVQKILQYYHLSPEYALFIDDDVINRESVRKIVGTNVFFSEDLFDVMGWFDQDRLKSMREHRNRTSDEKRYKDFKEFIAQSDMKVEIKQAEKEHLRRTTDLTNRTNEFNAVRNRYTEQQIEDMMNSPHHQIWIAFLSDRYGDYGLIAEMIIESKSNDTWFVKDICISCRTTGRGIGGNLMEHLFDERHRCSVKEIYGYVKDNPTMEKLYLKFNFVEEESTVDGMKKFVWRE